ncbi:MAG: hypothetical protein ACHQ16_02295 [Candidatus Lutacidiplasmatales archaeon]
MSNSTRFLTALAATAVLLLVLPGALAGAAPAPAIPTPAVTMVNSNGSAGYEVGQTLNSSITAFNTSWIQPRVNCTTTNSTALFDAFLVSNGTIQIAGTGVSCRGGIASSFGWYLFTTTNTSSRANLTKISTATLPVPAGSVVKVSWLKITGQMRVTISVGTHKVVKTHAFTGRDFIAEVGVVGQPAKHGILPLANFGTMAFGKSYTAVNGTNDVKANGTTKALGGMTLCAEVTLIDATSKVLAAPTALAGSGTSFKITWKAST